MAPRPRRSRRKNDDNHANCERQGAEERKKTRGSTFLLDIWCRDDDDDDKPKIKVEFNNTGQPIGENTAKFTGFLGVLSRNCKFAPIDIFDWRAMPDDKKSKMVQMIKDRFELPPGTESWALKSIGKKWKNWKGRIKARYYDPSLTLQELSNRKPPQIRENQWEKLLSHWNSEKSKAESARNKSHRAKKIMNHTTGRISFANVRDEYEKETGQPPSRLELFDQCYTDEKGDPVNDDVGGKLVTMREHRRLSEDPTDAVGENDSFAKAMGKDPPGLVRMYGLGVNPSDVWGAMPSRTTCHRISKESELALSKMEERVNEQSTKLEEQASQLTSQAAEIAELKAMVLHQRQTNDSIKVGSLVLIRSNIDFQSNVAEGRLVSLDPSRDVGGTLLGEHWCEVNVLTPIEWEAQLLRSYSWFKTVGDAIGTSIAWPCHLVTLKD